MEKFKIEIPDSNEFEKQSDKFHETRMAKRLHDKFRNKPFQERFKSVFIASHVASYFCNVYSILSASTFVFFYICGSFSMLPYSWLFAGVVTAIVLLLIEITQRALAPMLIKDWMQYGWQAHFAGMFCAIGVLSVFSVFCSYSGGFDLTDKLTATPVFVQPVQVDVQNIKDEHRLLISEARTDAENYKAANSWKGKLDPKRGRQYGKKQDHVKDLTQAMQLAVLSAQEENKQNTLKAEQEHEAALNARAQSVQGYGSGMATGAIIAQLLFFLCIWFIERYDFKTASQYAAPQENKPQAIIQQMEQQQIGFRQVAQKDTSTQHTQPDTYTHTVMHKGKAITKSLVQSRISDYTKKITKYEAEGKQNLVQSNMPTLVYWNQKLKEFK